MCKTKKCKHCNQELSVDNFYKDIHYKDGYKNICKNCFLIKKGKNYICEYCGKSFKCYEKRKFCCHECSVQFRDTRKIVICKICGKEFKQKRPNQSYCSQECRLQRKEKDKYENILCEICGKEFKRLKCCNKNKTHLYCSRECQWKGWSKFYSGKNSPEYNHEKSLDERLKDRKYIEYYEWRKQVYERDNYTCQSCGDDKGGNLVAHHKLNYSEHETLKTDIDNGITLCNKCHKLFHDTYGYTNNNEKQLYEFINNMSIRSEANTETIGTFND